MDLSPKDSRSFARILRSIADEYDDYFSEAPSVAASAWHRVALRGIASRLRAFHLPGKHNQENHGDGGGGNAPGSSGMPKAVVSIPFDSLPGDVSVSALPDGDGDATLSIAGRSTRLTEQNRKDLRSLILAAQYDDESKAGSDRVFRLYETTGLDEKGKVKSEYKVSLRPDRCLFASARECGSTYEGRCRRAGRGRFQSEELQRGEVGD